MFSTKSFILAAAGLAASVSAQNTCQQQLDICQSTQPLNESLCSSNFQACIASSSAGVPFPTSEQPSVCASALTTCQNTPPQNTQLCQQNYINCLAGIAPLTSLPPAAAPSGEVLSTITSDGTVDTIAVQAPAAPTLAPAGGFATTYTTNGQTITDFIPDPGFTSAPSYYPVATVTSCIPATSTAAAAAAATNSCDALRSNCQGQPNSNEAYCAAVFEGCLATASSSLAAQATVMGSVCFAAPVTTQPPASYTYSINMATQSNTINFASGMGARPDAATGVAGVVVGAAGFVLALL